MEHDFGLVERRRTGADREGFDDLEFGAALEVGIEGGGCRSGLYSKNKGTERESERTRACRISVSIFDGSGGMAIRTSESISGLSRGDQVKERERADSRPVNDPNPRMYWSIHGR